VAGSATGPKIVSHVGDHWFFDSSLKGFAMRILVIVDCYLPSLKSGAQLIHDLGVEFRRQGHEVTILTPSDTICKPFQVSTEDGLRIARVKTRTIKSRTKLFRAVREARLSATLWGPAKSFLLANPADLIVFYSPTIFFGPLVQRLKSHWGCPAYLILRDIFPQWAVDAGILRKGLVWRYFRRKEIEQYAVADLIGVESPANLEYFAREFPKKPYRLQVLYNWAKLNGRDLPSTGYRERLSLHGKVVFFYGGNLGVVQDLDNIIRLAKRLTPQKQIHFLLVGEGSEVSKLERMIAEKDLSNIQILSAVPQQQYMSMLSEADVGLISLDRRLRTHNVPGKLLGYINCGKPVLASVNPGNDLFEILEKDQAGFCLLNGDDDGLYAAALMLAKDPELRTSMGNNSRKLLERLFSVDAAVRQIMKHFQQRANPVEERTMMQTANSSRSASSFRT
jgi:glycosyltransferase involved in cell wall biosynthesis